MIPSRQPSKAVEGISISEGSVRPLALLSQGRRAINVLATPLFTNAFYLWASAAVMAASGFVFWALAAALYDTADVGRGAAALSAVVLLAVVSQLGLGLGLIRFLPHSGDRGPLLINSSLSVAGLVAIVASCIFLLGVPLWSPELGFLRHQPLYSLAFVAFALASTVSIVQDQTFIALRQAKYVFIRNTLTSALKIILPGAMVAFFAAFGIVAAGGIATLFGLALGIVILRRTLPAYGPAIVFNREPVATLAPFAIGNHVADLSLMAPSLILPLMVVNVSGAEKGGYFYIGWFLGQLLFGLSAYLALSLFAEGSYGTARPSRLTLNALTMALLAGGAGIALAFLFGDEVLLAFGSDYSAEATDLLRLVALASLPAAITNVYLGMERVRKRVPVLVALSVLITVVTLGVSYLLLPPMGISGAGVGLLTGQGIGAAVALASLLRGWSGTFQVKADQPTV